MLIPLSSFDHRRHKVMKRMTKIITYKRTFFLTIAILGFINYYFHSSQYNSNHKLLETQSTQDTKTTTQQNETSSLYLYPPHEAHPFVIDYNPTTTNNDQYNFRTSPSPKVIQFYDPKCGACQAFKYNYIEIAKQIIQHQKQPHDVQFYGVSCALYKSTCDEFGVHRFPKILVFPDNNINSGGGDVRKEDGIEVPKGTGTIYFVTARILKALRTKVEIERDGVAASSKSLLLRDR